MEASEYFKKANFFDVSIFCRCVYARLIFSAAASGGPKAAATVSSAPSAHVMTPKSSSLTVGPRAGTHVAPPYAPLLPHPASTPTDGCDHRHTKGHTEQPVYARRGVAVFYVVGIFPLSSVIIWF